MGTDRAGFPQGLSRAEYERLPAAQRALCQSASCTHTPRRGQQFPDCRGHCRCPGFEKVKVRDGFGTHIDVRRACQYRVRRKERRVLDLSAPILWYWQITGESIFTDMGLNVSRQRLLELSSDDGGRGLGFALERQYNVKAQAWRDVHAPSKRSKKRKCAAKADE